jgi:rubrerythrin
MKLQDIKKIGVAGGGTMGSGIAQVFAQKGYPVVVTDLEERFLENTKRIIQLNQKTLINEGLLTEEEAEESLKLITYSTDKRVFADADLIVEAIIEKMDIKQDFWKEVEGIAPENSIFATNTSGLSINGICSKLKNKKRFIGMHWWNPPHIIPLIELIKNDETSDETVQVLNEMEGYEFYKMAGDQAKTQGNKEAFNHLANEELKHAEYLKKLWAALSDGGELKIEDILSSGIEIPSPEIYRWDKVDKAFATLAMSIYGIGMQMEKNSIDFYEDAKKKFSSKSSIDLFDLLIKWEKVHLDQFTNQYQILKEEWWAEQQFAPF